MLLVSNRNLAQELQGHIDRLKSRFEDDQLNTMSRLKFYSIEEKIKELSSANHLIQKTWNLYYWIRDEGKAKRTESPMDTLPASESMYAFAIGVKGDLPVSPLRGLDSLNRMLKDKWRIVAKLDPQEKMGAPPKDSISVNF
ncbi:hypothetical protein CFE70_003944 [Pyrenophora teres f. teres 0-1]|uniref:Uncharacterized protein n=2 Tax=Pyrenophora teres f. teres TaxID=97479 RepID=E3RDL8_PYRTT|nr:hypothetical protein PTT_02500 [Pyrenophora teres f. teres 0-1]KAK1907683.1 hypothetical protein P3342_006011 [Pyrenophora teres f. teres]CAA9960517.1 hypothetical protein PTMSG1_03919 [Pyrenophora teres f. maculata]